MPNRASAPNKQTAKNGRAGQSGTRLANLVSTPSYTLDSASRGMGRGWGGPRNRADRVSLHLSRRQVIDLIAATLFARSIGKPFNRHWTVNCELAGIADHDAARFTGKLIDLARKQARRDGGELAAAWAREGGDGKDTHAHIMLYLPPGMTLRNRTRRWIKAAGGTARRRASKVRIIAGMKANQSVGGGDGTGATLANVSISNGGADGVNLTKPDIGEHYRANADAVLAYLLKGADAATAGELGLRLYGEAGPIIGKRAGFTQNIGPTARARWRDDTKS